MEFVWIPPGEFMMGSPEDEEGRKEGELLHEVELDGFWMGKYPVTQGQWELVMGDNPSVFQKGDDYPVETVSWDDAQAFIQKLQFKLGGTANFVLPTEAQWEYACRAGTTTPFYFGETISPDQANYDGNYIYGNGYDGVYRGSTTPVGLFPANAYGLFDMHGNVWEWCRDLELSRGYSYHPKKNPYISGGGSRRVRRGGCWYGMPNSARSANRMGLAPVGRSNNLGFRISMVM